MSAALRGRFYVEPIEDEFQVVDSRYSVVISAPTKTGAERLARFARQCVRQQGDVNLYAAPYSPSDPFTADDAFQVRHQGVERDDPWNLTPCDDLGCDCREVIERARKEAG